MTGPHSETESPGTRPISVAELLARNGNIGAPAVTRRRRRRRGDNDAVSVAELTGEIPVIRDDDHDESEHGTNGTVEVDESAATARSGSLSEDVPEQAKDQPKTAYWSEPEPRWPKSVPRAERVAGLERSAYPRPVRQTDGGEAERAVDLTSAKQSDAEGMSPDPAVDYADIPVDVMDADVREAEPATDDSAYVRSFLQDSDSALDLDSTLFSGQTLADEMARGFGGRRATDSSALDHEPDKGRLHFEPRHVDTARAPHGARDKVEAVWRGSLTVLQSILAVAFGAGLFIAFDQLWRWNSLVALVLSVLVILGLVAGVRVVRKTEDIASTLIAVAVGALITLGPLALSLQSG